MPRLCAFILSTAVSLAPAARAAATQITIDNFAFIPQRVTIPAGGTIVWTNRDDMPHEVADAADPRGKHSPPLDTGDSYARSFAKPGEYRYFCSIHPRMQGSIVVK